MLVRLPTQLITPAFCLASALFFWLLVRIRFGSERRRERSTTALPAAAEPSRNKRRWSRSCCSSAALRAIFGETVPGSKSCGIRLQANKKRSEIDENRATDVISWRFVVATVYYKSAHNICLSSHLHWQDAARWVLVGKREILHARTGRASSTSANTPSSRPRSQTSSQSTQRSVCAHQ